MSDQLIIPQAGSHIVNGTTSNLTSGVQARTFHCGCAACMAAAEKLKAALSHHGDNSSYTGHDPLPRIIRSGEGSDLEKGGNGHGDTLFTEPSGQDTVPGNTSTTAVLAYGSSSSAAINSNGDQDWFQLVVTAGKTYDITMDAVSQTSDLATDCHLVLHDATGAVIASGIEGAFGADSVLTYTATTTGVLYISAQTISGTTTGSYKIRVGQPYTPTADNDDDGVGTTSHISVGETITGDINTPGDQDWYAITLVGGQGYNFDLSSLGGATLADTILYVYNAQGQLVALDDDGAANHNSHLNFSPATSGTYYVVAASFGDSQHGTYNLSVSNGPIPSLTDSIDWGTQLTPAGGVIKVYFAASGETFDDMVSTGWTAYEIQQAMAALAVYSNYLPLTFVQTSTAAEADFKLVTTTSLGDGVLAYMNPPGEANAGVGVFARDTGAWSQTASPVMQPGGLGFDTLVHEFGHGLGLAHPFDNGGTSTIMMGVTDTYDYDGLGYQNQGLYTIMAYNDGWPGGPVPDWTNYSHGFGSTPMAIDVSALQAKYGANTTYHTGNDTYFLDGSLNQTTYMSIWDAGGTDMISAEHLTNAQSATIDLRQANMTYGTASGYVFDPTLETVSGGAASFVTTVGGAFTINVNVDIENANGHAGNDTIIGNSLANVIRGLGGSDKVYARGGDDQIFLSVAGSTAQDFIDGGDGNDTLTLDVTFASVTGSENNGVITFTNSSGLSIAVSNVETFVFSDGTFNYSSVVSHPPKITGTLAGTVANFGATVLTTNMLGFTDPDTSTTTFVIAGSTGGSAITVDGYIVQQFTSAQLQAGRVSFTHWGINSSSPATLTLRAFDGVHYSDFSALTFTINNDPDQDMFLGGTAASDSLGTGAGNDHLVGLAGDDFLNGGAGADILDGGDGFDMVGYASGNSDQPVVASLSDPSVNTGQAAGDTYISIEGLYGSFGNDFLTGDGANNALIAYGGNDYLDGRAGADTMVGSYGADTYVVDDAGDVVRELYDWLSSDDGSTDLVISSINYALGDYIENLNLTDTAATGTGNALGNTINGNAVANTLDGGGGNDRLFGQAGDDSLAGGAGSDYLEGGFGSDTYQFGALEGSDEINNAHAGDDPSAVDRIVIGAGLAPSDFAVARDSQGNLYLTAATGEQIKVTGFFNGADFEIQQVVFNNGTVWTAAQLTSMAVATAGPGDDVLDGGTTDDVIDGKGGNDTLHGSDGNDTLIGAQGDDKLYGDAGNDGLNGGDGNDLLDGGTGSDSMTGGAGDDTFVIDAAGDTVIEANGGGTDTVTSAAVNVSLFGLYAENIILTGSTNLTALGNGFNNVITGNSGANVLNGAVGSDTLQGGDGNDTYYVDNTGDIVIENAGEGTDTVTASVSYVLSANVEVLTLSGSAAINATGNDSDNVLLGNAGSNILSGGAGSDDLQGGAGNDVLDGGAGNDTMTGGAGNDTYYVGEAGDTVTELNNEGTDTVIAWRMSYSIVGMYVENIILAGEANGSATGNNLANALTGDASNNLLDGGAGADILTGGLGDDTYYVDNLSDIVIENVGEGTDTVYALNGYSLSAGLENLVLMGTGVGGGGNAADNSIAGNDADNSLLGWDGNDILMGQGGNDDLLGGNGNDRLDGGTGADILRGGAGDDSFYLDNAGDKVSELNNQGNDTVYSSVTFALGGQYIENVVLTGTANINLNGNGLANNFTGNAGNNTFNGGVGGDTMAGGLGDDVYYVDNIGDIVIEDANAGRDTVSSSISYTLADNVEVLTLNGYQAINGTGNALDNTIAGNGNINVLNGGDGKDVVKGLGGNDILTGGNGADQFRFEAAGISNGVDHITDFVSGTDKLVFNSADYGFAKGYVLTAAELHGGGAVGAGPQFLYNSVNHTLYFDTDGAGGVAPVAVIVFDNSATPAAGDFIFI